MAIALDAVKSDSHANVTGHPQTFSFTTGSGSQRLMIAFIYCKNGTSNPPYPTIGSISYNGVALTQIGSQVGFGSGSNACTMAAFYLIAPASGANTFSYDITGLSGVADQSAQVMTFTGAHQSAPIDTDKGDAGVSSVTMATSVDNDWVLDGCQYTGSVAPSPTSGQSFQDQTRVGTDYYMSCTTRSMGTHGSVTESWDSTLQTLFSVAISPAPATTTSSSSSTSSVSTSSSSVSSSSSSSSTSSVSTSSSSISTTSASSSSSSVSTSSSSSSSSSISSTSVSQSTSTLYFPHNLVLLMDK